MGKADTAKAFLRSTLRTGCAALCCAATISCTLVDQTSFGGAPRPPAPSEMARAFASGGQLPLLTVRPDDGVPYEDQLRQAIEAAETQHGSVQFRIEASVPAQGDADQQALALDAIQAASRAMLDQMGLDGITPDRVELSARADPQVQKRVIKLFQK